MHFVDCFLEKYGDLIEDFAICDILKIFYVYKECNGQFSVDEYIKKLKKGRK